MKKSMILLGMLSIGYTYAQEGNVGINTQDPQATLDINPNAENAKIDATTNQGIIAPRLSKVRVANIETPIEGTLVYVTDENPSPISAYTGTDTKVSKITEKGYYYYNGTEWVKSGNNAEWVYDDTTKRINLKRSGQNTGFTAKVFFDSEKGRYINVDTTENVMREASILGADITSNILTEGSSFNVSHLKADKINFNYTKNPDFFYASKDESFLQVNNEAIKTAGLHQGGHYSGINTYTYTDTSVTENLGTMIGGLFRSVHRGSGRLQNGLLGIGTNGILKNGSAREVHGAHSYSTIHSPGQVINVTGTFSQTHLGKEDINLNITNSSSFWGANVVYSGGKISEISGILLNTDIRGTQELAVNNIIGFRYMGLNNASIYPINPNATINGHYGIFIDDITKAKDDKNYAIYSNAGKVRFGDNVGVGIDNPSEKLEVNGAIKVANTASTCTANNRGTIKFVNDNFYGCKSTGWVLLNN